MKYLKLLCGLVLLTVIPAGLFCALWNFCLRHFGEPLSLLQAGELYALLVCLLWWYGFTAHAIQEVRRNNRLKEALNVK